MNESGNKSERFKLKYSSEVMKKKEKWNIKKKKKA